jgi:hypothetical protein
MNPAREPSGVSVARPTTVPICAAAFNRPEARPARSGNAAVPAVVEAVAAIPRPRPITT